MHTSTTAGTVLVRLLCSRFILSLDDDGGSGSRRFQVNVGWDRHAISTSIAQKPQKCLWMFRVVDINDVNRYMLHRISGETEDFRGFYVVRTSCNGHNYSKKTEYSIILVTFCA